MDTVEIVEFESVEELLEFVASRYTQFQDKDGNDADPWAVDGDVGMSWYDQSDHTFGFSYVGCDSYGEEYRLSDSDESDFMFYGQN